MPDNEGKLNEEERIKIVNWLNSHSGGLIYCTICKQTNWAITEHLVRLSIHTPQGLIIGGPTYPCFQLLCTNCGAIQLINAVKTGIILQSPPDKKEVPNG
jgi:hypothetical protein